MLSNFYIFKDSFSGSDLFLAKLLVADIFNKFLVAHKKQLMFRKYYDEQIHRKIIGKLLLYI